MPSGAKKRKAAKKKMGNQSTNNPPTPSHDDVKDVGDVSHQKGEEEGSVQIERESVEKDGKIGGDDEGSSGSSSSGSSSSSSDDESNDVNSGPPVVEIALVVDSGKSVDIAPVVESVEPVDIAPVVDSVKPDDLLSETPAEPITDAIVEEANVLAVETPVVDEIPSLIEKTEVADSEEKTESCLEDKAEIAADLVGEASKAEVETVHQFVENTNVVSDLNECIVQVQQNEDLVDAASKTEEEIVHQFVENTNVVSSLNECMGEVQQNDDALTPISVPVSNGAEIERDSVTQPLLEHPVQKTSWKGCCGLCELFTGSSR